MTTPSLDPKPRPKLKDIARSTEDRITELERTVKALVKAMVEVESEIDSVMPEGTYYGETFED